MKAKSISTWTGTWKEGKGEISGESGYPKDAPYTFSSRFEGTAGASPEELFASAHAGCFNQALANNFGMNSLVAESIETTVEIEFGYGDDGTPTIFGSHISVVAKVPGASEEIFSKCAERASLRCTISKILRCEIKLDATLRT